MRSEVAGGRAETLQLTREGISVKSLYSWCEVNAFSAEKCLISISVFSLPIKVLIVSLLELCNLE